MKLKSIEIENFRCFQHFSLDFAPSITVLIGRNGTGKSTLIKSITDALSFIFAANKDPKNFVSLQDGNPDLKIVNIPSGEAWWNETERKFANYISIKADARFENQDLSWELMKPSTSNAGLRTTLYQNAYSQFMHLYQTTQKLPLFAFYSDSFPHINSRISKFAQKIFDAGNSFPRNFGYYQWDDETSCSSLWKIRYQNCYLKWLSCSQNEKLLSDELQELIVAQNHTVTEIEKKKDELSSIQNETKRYFDEWNAIFMCLKKYSKASKEYTDSIFEINSLYAEQRGKDWNLVIKMNSKSVLFDQLPAGYKRLYTIVLDIAYRSYILNGHTNSSGIVLIDELDLHLHPSLEQEVLQRFRDTFPNIQFIISTHSPLILSNLNTAEKDENGPVNIIYRLMMGQEIPEILPNIFGVDYDASVSDFMNTPSRNLQIKDLIDDYVILKYNKHDEKAEEVYNRIIETVGFDNHLILSEIEKKLRELEAL